MTTDLALQRLEASRASIHAELVKMQSPDEASSPQSGGPSTGWPFSMPLFDTATRALRLWWRRHPARPVVDIASDAGAQALKPLVRAHPVAAMALAMAAGAAMVVWRPWRSRVTAAVWAGLGAQLTSGLVSSVLNPGTLSALLGRWAQTTSSSSSSNTQAPPPS
jgi:hypothetical protein